MTIISFWSIEYLMGRWRPTIGDPGFMGWFTVTSYFACAVVAFISVLINQMGGRKSCLFWSLVTLLMIFLGINKQLDLQSLFTEMGRQIAKAQGWMAQRRIVQFWFIVGFGTSAFTGFLLFAIIMRNLFRRFMFAFTGLFFLLSFIIVRAASFHHFDEMLGFKLFGAKMNWVLELTGIYLILVGGFKEIIYLKKINAR